MLKYCHKYNLTIILITTTKQGCLLTLSWRANTISLCLHDFLIRNWNLACSSDMAQCWSDLPAPFPQNMLNTRSSKPSCCFYPAHFAYSRQPISFMLDPSPAFSSGFLSCHRLSGCLFLSALSEVCLLASSLFLLGRLHSFFSWFLAVPVFTWPDPAG